MKTRNFLLFTAGQVGIMLLARFLFQWIILFTSEEQILSSGEQFYLFSPGLVGAALLGFRLFDGITDPIAGYLSDHWHKRGHERRRLLLYTLVLPVIGLVLCFLPNFTMSLTLRWVFLLSGMFLFFVGYTFYAIPYWSLIDDYSEGDSNIRRKLSNLLGVGLLIATAIGFMVTPAMVEHLGYVPSALLVGVAAIFFMFAPYLAAPANHQQKAKDPDRSATHTAPSPIELYRAFFRILRDRQFMAILLIFIGSQMSLTIMTSASPFIAIELLHGDTGDVAYLLGPLLGVAFPCFLITPWLSSRFGWKHAVVTAGKLLGLAYILIAFTGIAVIGSAWTTAIILFGIGGPMIAVLLGLEGEVITSCAREQGGESVSLYFGVYNLFVKACNGLAIFIAGILVELSRGAMGSLAIRATTIAAGLCLFAGVIGYSKLGRLTPKTEPIVSDIIP